MLFSSLFTTTIPKCISVTLRVHSISGLRTIIPGSKASSQCISATLRVPSISGLRPIIPGHYAIMPASSHIA